MVCSEKASLFIFCVRLPIVTILKFKPSPNILSIHSVQYREMRYFTQSKFSVVLYYDLNYDLENEKNMPVPLELVEKCRIYDMSVRPSQFWPLVSHSNTSSSLSLYLLKQWPNNPHRKKNNNTEDFAIKTWRKLAKRESILKRLDQLCCQQKISQLSC